ncbi:hypothetical protein COCNU_scaffold007611G000010 [Cocos nucifera]|nr:hypothetical protein [Cocos nucifera]
MAAAQLEKNLETEKAEVIQAFHSSNDFLEDKLEFVAESYLGGFTNCKAKVQSLFLDIEGMDIDEGARSGGTKDALIEVVEIAPQPLPMTILVEPDVPTDA